MSLTCPLQSLLKQQFSTFFQVLVLVNQFDSVDRYFQQRQSEQFKCISFYADWLYTVSGWMVETKLCLSSARRTERAILRGFDSCNKARLYTGICRIRSWFGKKCPHSLHFSPWWKISRTTLIDGKWMDEIDSLPITLTFLPAGTKNKVRQQVQKDLVKKCGNFKRWADNFISITEQLCNWSLSIKSLEETKAALSFFRLTKL